MPLDFPSNPSDGQVYDDYYYDATVGAWQSNGGTTLPNIFRNVEYTTAQTTLVPLKAKGLPSQTADLQDWIDSTTSVLARVTNTGGISTKDRITISSDASTSTNARLFVNSITASDIPMIARGATSQTADLQHWQNSLGVALAKIDVSGVVTATNYKTSVTTAGSDTVALNFSTTDGLVTRTATGTITFTGAGYAAGSTITARVIAGAASRTLAFPAGWIFVGSKPSTLAANKSGILTVTSFGTTEADCIASWVAQL